MRKTAAVQALLVSQLSQFTSATIARALLLLQQLACPSVPRYVSCFATTLPGNSARPDGSRLRGGRAAACVHSPGGLAAVAEWPGGPRESDARGRPLLRRADQRQGVGQGRRCGSALPQLGGGLLAQAARHAAG